MSNTPETRLERGTRYIRNGILALGVGEVAIGSEISTTLLASGVSHLALAGLVEVARRALLPPRESQPTAGLE